MDAATLRRYRKELRLTQAELGHELGVTRNSVTRWEIGMHPIPAPVAKLIERLVRERRRPKRE